MSRINEVNMRLLEKRLDCVRISEVNVLLFEKRLDCCVYTVKLCCIGSQVSCRCRVEVDCKKCVGLCVSVIPLYSVSSSVPLLRKNMMELLSLYCIYFFRDMH